MPLARLVSSLADDIYDAGQQPHATAFTNVRQSHLGLATAGVSLSPESVILPRHPSEVSELKLINFGAGACSHCKSLTPTWRTLRSRWDQVAAHFDDQEDLPLISFEKKECYDEQWRPGKDFNECQKFHVKGFPTIKLFVAEPDGKGYSSVDYEGERTSDAIIKFLKDSTDLPASSDETRDETGMPASEHEADISGGQDVDAENLEASDGARDHSQLLARAFGGEAIGEDALAQPQCSAPPSGKEEFLSPAFSAEELLQARSRIVTAAFNPMLLPLMSCLPTRRFGGFARATCIKQVSPKALPLDTARFI